MLDKGLKSLEYHLVKTDFAVIKRNSSDGSLAQQPLNILLVTLALQQHQILRRAVDEQAPDELNVLLSRILRKLSRYGLGWVLR